MDHTVGLWNLLLAQQALPYVLPSEPHTRLFFLLHLMNFSPEVGDNWTNTRRSNAPVVSVIAQGSARRLVFIAFTDPTVFSKYTYPAMRAQAQTILHVSLSHKTL